MISYRGQLTKIGVPAKSAVSYKGSFFLAGPSLRETLRSMDFPASFFEVIPGDELDKNWTEEVQGCAFAQGRWFFVSNASDEKRLYVFDGASGTKLKTWNLKGVPPAATPGFAFYHFGAIIIDGGFIYIDHWHENPASGQVLVLQGDGLSINFSRWIPLTNVADVGGRVGMIAVTTKLQRIVTSGGKLNIDRVCLHSLVDGTYLKQLKLDPPIKDDGFAQGGFWSPNNHLFISSGEGKFGESAKGHQHIYCYSPLNGKRLGDVQVTTKAGRQELEGCCYADVTRNSRKAYIHAVLLENEEGAKDDVYLKSFSADYPELI
jgi:hypothetical protein